MSFGTGSGATPAILIDNPKLEGESWEAWGERLAEKYKTPSATPNLPNVPSYGKLPETWIEYGTQWKDYYNTKVAGQPLPNPNGPTLPPLPTTEATGEQWAAWGQAVGEAWNAYATEKGVDLSKVVEGLKAPEPPSGGSDWSYYATEWEAYGNQVQERFNAALAAKSAKSA